MINNLIVRKSKDDALARNILKNRISRLLEKSLHILHKQDTVLYSEYTP